MHHVLSQQRARSSECGVAVLHVLCHSLYFFERLPNRIRTQQLSFKNLLFCAVKFWSSGQILPGVQVVGRLERKVALNRINLNLELGQPTDVHFLLLRRTTFRELLPSHPPVVSWKMFL